MKNYLEYKIRIDKNDMKRTLLYLYDEKDLDETKLSSEGLETLTYLLQNSYTDFSVVEV